MEGLDDDLDKEIVGRMLLEAVVALCPHMFLVSFLECFVSDCCHDQI